MELVLEKEEPGASRAREEMIWVDPATIRGSAFGEDVNPPATPEEEKALELSIAESGVKVPLVCERNKYRPNIVEVVAGTRRLRIAKKLGLPVVPVIFMTFESVEDKRRFAVMDNIARRQLSNVGKANLGLSYWKSLESDTDKYGESAASRQRAAEAAGISQTTLVNYRYVINSGEQDIIADMKAGKLKINAAFTKTRARVKGKEASDEAPPPIRVTQMTVDLKTVINVIKVLPKLSERIHNLAESTDKLGEADRKKLRKQITDAQEIITKAKAEDVLGKALEAIDAFQSKLT